MSIATSGGFDQIHDGHIALLEAATEHGHVVVILNSDAWLMRKKGYVLLPWDARARVLRAIRFVTEVVPVDDFDGTVCEALRRVHPYHFANGGDRNTPDPREHVVCKELGIMELFGIGGGKIRSSSELLKGFALT